MTVGAQLQRQSDTQLRGTARLLVEMPSKRRPSWDPEIIRVRMVAARKRLGLSRKEAGDKAGMGEWSWYKKEPSGGDGFTPEQCVTFAEAVGAPTLFPFYDWDHADEIDERMGWK